MTDPTDGLEPHVALKITLANVLIYWTPLLWFGWLGPFWKAASVITVALGVWRSPGFLRRAFGVLFLLSTLIWGTHAQESETDWPGPPLLIIWWAWSFLTRWHADGAKAELEAARPEREWE